LTTEIHNCAGAEVAAIAPTDQAANGGILRHIYVHIPFCARICPYCAFYKERPDSSQTQRFCEALLQELQQQVQQFSVRPQTIFFGGGTPTALSRAQLEFLLRGFQETLNLSNLVEWTVEANPGSVSARKAEVLRSLGVSRISLGVQSWDNAQLQILGREHDAAQAEHSFRSLREAEFDNINIDLMFGIPGQTPEMWRETLTRTIALEPDHISAYCLTYEEDTEFFARHVRGEYRTDNDSDAQFFETTMDVLEAAGYQQYEISNYARPGYESSHNRAYWAGADYLGVGPSAFSTVRTRRWQNVPDYRAYADKILSGGTIISSDEDLSPGTRRRETTALLLRTRSGVPSKWLIEKQEAVDEFIRLGLMKTETDRTVLTRRGKLLADSVAAPFI
jgi:oxygen-independent coproporphyrinogen-3 oxidase